MDDESGASNAGEEEDIEMNIVEVLEVAKKQTEQELGQLRRQRKRQREEDSSSSSSSSSSLNDETLNQEIKNKQEELKTLVNKQEDIRRRQSGKRRKSPTPQDETKQELATARVEIEQLKKKILELEGGKKNE